MVYVENVPTTSHSADVGAGINGVVKIFTDNWLLFLVIIIGAVAVYFAIYFYKLAEEERKERDSDAFTLFNNVQASCILNADKSKIKKRYSLLNLLWFGIPFKMIEQSVKYVDCDNNLIGYYRGQHISQNNMMNVLLYKTKSFIFFENLFILKYPINYEFETSTADKNGKIIKNKKRINIENAYFREQYNHDVRINCYGTEKVGLYYFMPVFIINPETKDVLDLRAYVEDKLLDNSFQITNMRLNNLFSTASKKMIEMNPHVQMDNSTSNIKQRNQEIDAEEMNPNGNRFR